MKHIIIRLSIAASALPLAVSAHTNPLPHQHGAGSIIHWLSLYQGYAVFAAVVVIAIFVYAYTIRNKRSED